MNFYLIVLGLMSVPAYVFPESRRVAWCMAGGLWLLSALRFYVGFDYVSYFEWAQNGIDPYQALMMEPISKGMLELALHTGEPQLFFVLSSLVIIFPFAYSYIHFSRQPALSLLGFFCLPLLFLVSLSIVRQSMATALLFFTLTVLERRPKFTLAMFLTAGFFHYSAWVVVLIFPFLRYFSRPISNGWYIIVLIFAPIFSSGVMHIVAPYLPFYTNHVDIDVGSGQKLIVFYYLLAFIVLSLRYLGAKFSSRHLNFFILGVALLGLLGSINEVVGRLAYYFLPFFALLLPGVVSILRPVVLSRLLVVFSLGGTLILQLYIGSKNPVKDPYQPYSFYPDWFNVNLLF